MDHIEVAEDAGIVTITLNRPERLNAFAGRMRRELAEALAAGDLRLPISNRFPFGQAREAIRLASRGGAGKVLITF